MFSFRIQGQIKALPDRILELSDGTEKTIDLYKEGDISAAVFEAKRQLQVCKSIKEDIRSVLLQIADEPDAETAVQTLGMQMAAVEQKVTLLDDILFHAGAVKRDREISQRMELESKRLDLKKRLEEGG